jgi:hypothetical protein
MHTQATAMNQAERAVWQAGGWLLFVAGQATIILLGLAVWAVGRTTLRTVEARGAR